MEPPYIKGAVRQRYTTAGGSTDTDTHSVYDNHNVLVSFTESQKIVFFILFHHLWERMTALTNGSRPGGGTVGAGEEGGGAVGGRIQEVFSDSEDGKKR